MDLTDRLLSFVAWVWRGRAEIIETAGAACIAYAAALVYLPAAWLVIGVWLVLRAYVTNSKATSHKADG